MKLEDIEIVQFHPRHIELAYLREYERKFFDRNEDMFGKIENLFKGSFRSVTLLHEGRILSICGFIKLLDGVAEIWQLPTIYAKKSPIHYTKAMHILIDFIVKEYKIRRLSTVSPDDKEHRAWMESLGFAIEGTFKEYTDLREDFLAWAKIFREDK